MSNETPFGMVDNIAAQIQQSLNPIKPKEQKRRIPYIPLAGVQVTKPILSASVMARLDEAVAPTQSPTKWKKWGMKQKGTTLLLHGPSGTGKTTISRYLAKKVGNGMIALSMADVGGGDPGDTERGIHDVFKYGIEKKYCPIQIDECDGLLWSRDKAGPDSMWMVSVVNYFLTQIEVYKGLIILCTNHPHFLDSALKRRITDTIEVPIPDVTTRMELWLQKIPNEYPLQLNETQLKEISRISLTGAEIENCIERESRKAIRLTRSPKWESLLEISREVGRSSNKSN